MVKRRISALLGISALVIGLAGVSAVATPAAADGEVSAKGSSGQGYLFVASDGGIFNYGDAEFFGSAGNLTLKKPIVGAATDQDGDGYYLVASDGGIFAYQALFHGSAGNLVLNQPIVGMATDRDSKGYWSVASDGGIFSYEAKFAGSTGALTLNQPIVGMAADPDGDGYWLVARDGGIFSFNADFHGSMGGTKLNQPIVGMAADPDGEGYWMVAADGGIFAFKAAFPGSAGNIKLNSPVVGMGATVDGLGYWLFAADGGVFNYGPTAKFLGSAGALKLNKPIVGGAVTPLSALDFTQVDFAFPLRGRTELPGPGDADGFGFAFLDIDEDEVCSYIFAFGIDAATAAHVHTGASNVAGPVKVQLAEPNADGVGSGCTSFTDTTFDDQIMARPQDFYVNVHNAAFPGGAIRGQVAGELAYAVVDAGPDSLISFNTAAPDELLLGPTVITGGTAGDQIVGIDIRPKDGKLYILEVATDGNSADDAASIYTLNPATGAATVIGAPFTIPDSATHGFDFNPVADRIRIVTDGGANLRINPDTGVISDTDTNLAYEAGDPNFGTAPAVAAVAYTDNTDQTGLPPADQSTELFVIDHSLDILVSVAAPNSGALSTEGPLGVDVAGVNGFDIAPDVSGEYALAAMTPLAGTGAKLYSIDISSGQAFDRGAIGNGTLPLSGLTIV